MSERIRDFRAREDGQAMVEYVLILFLVSIVAIAVLTLIGLDIIDVFQTVEDALLGNDG